MTQSTASDFDDQETSYYEAHRKVYPRDINGRFANLRKIAAWVLLGIFYGLPWLRWHGRQAILFDLPARQFHIFSLTLWPQDFIFLTWLLVIAALSLFFFTAVAGRLWCGYACPQTVWTEVFIWMERITEGDRSRRMKLDAAPWSGDKLARKGAKQFLWVAFSLLTGFTFVGFFTPIEELGGLALHAELGPWETFWIFFYGFATYGNAGFLREQVCRYMCPYARFQSAMFDRNTLIITYDAERGDPRGGRRRGENPRDAGLGDCTDCTLCVQVCPTGIDIRSGLQSDCIACAACIDACDSVMDRIGYARGLVRYTTQNSLDHGRSHILRPRVIVYFTLLASLCSGFALALARRAPVALDVLHDRNSLYRVLDSGEIENVYLLKIMNKDGTAHRFQVRLDPRHTANTTLQLDPSTPPFDVPDGTVFNAAVRVRRPAHADDRSITPLRFAIEAVDAPTLRADAEARFFAPRE
ncbi:MAG: cytochrome c oxidase accessory protein CcoG [Gammaproteobacteria bacterium]|nr:cytochrome c oxidase accessory protein CcoG [Gammaproteobacteria bacterium]